MPYYSDNIQKWLNGKFIYADNLTIYTVIISFWFFIGCYILGFELQGYNAEQNFFFNLVVYLLICIAMALCPLWFNLFFKKRHENNIEKELNEYLDKLGDNYQQKIIDHINCYGLKKRPIQRWALVFLGVYFLFEVFFISAWVKDMVLVWQPNWSLKIIEWVRHNTNSAPISDGGSLFYFNPKFKEDDFIYQYYQTEMEFLNSELGKSAMLFTFFKTIGFFGSIISLFIALGLYKIDINNIKNQPKYSLWTIIASTVFVLGIGLIALMALMMTLSIAEDTKIIPIAHHIQGWFSVFSFNIMYVFSLIFITYFIGWLYVMIGILFSVFHFIKPK